MLLRFECIERRRGQEQASGLAIADRRDDIRRNGGRHDAEPHFGQRELRRLRADGDVRARNEADAATEHVAVDACDDGLCRTHRACAGSARAAGRRRRSAVRSRPSSSACERCRRRRRNSRPRRSARRRVLAHRSAMCRRARRAAPHRRAVERVVFVRTIQRQRRDAARIELVVTRGIAASPTCGQSTCGTRRTARLPGGGPRIAALIAWPSTRRVSIGSMTPSSHSRAVA